MSDNEKTDRDLLCEIRADVRHLVSAQADHETRIRVVEKRQWTIGGAITAGVALFEWLKTKN
jgi:hypothetical protein